MALENINSPCGVNEMENVLSQLECPFTWDMDIITKEFVITDKVHSNDDKEECLPEKDENYDREQDIPYRDDMDHLFRLMKHIMTIYVSIKAKIDSNEILHELEKCDEDMTGLKKYNHPEVSVDIVHFVLKSTQIFVFKELNLTKELNQTLSEIKKNEKLNSKQKSTLNACRSICWWVCNCLLVLKSEHFIREAIKDNPKCELWYFILGKNLRRKRRNTEIWSSPTEEEIDSFLKAYNMSANPGYGIFVAQMYREMKRYTDAENMYNMIFEQNPNVPPTILLRLALGFMNFRNFTKAKVCLDKVEAIQPFRSMYLHYRGIYHLYLNEYEEAVNFLKEACNASIRNIGAERQYLECALKLDESFDIIQYLHHMIEKYKNFPKQKMQQLLLDLALAYWERKGDVRNALIYFHKAVESNPEATCLTQYFCQFLRIEQKNIYQLLNGGILPIVRKRKGKFEQSCIDRAEDLQKYCDQYFSCRNFAETVNCSTKFN